MVSVTTRLPGPLGFHIVWLMKKKLLSFIWKSHNTLSIYSARNEISLSDVANLDLVLAAGGGGGWENCSFTVWYSYHVKFSCVKLHIYSWMSLFFIHF